MASTHTKTQGSAMPEDIQDLYDAVMIEIEPDLTSWRIGALGFIYMDEKPEEHQERMERYKKAFILFEERWKQLMGTWKDHVYALREQILGEFKTTSDAQDAAQLSKLDQSIQDS